MDVTADVRGDVVRMSYGYRTDIRISYGYRTLLDASDVGDLPECMCGVARATWSIPDSPFLDTNAPTPPVAKTLARAQVPAVKYHRVDVGLPWGTVWMSCGYRTDKSWMYGGCTADDRTDDVGIS